MRKATRIVLALAIVAVMTTATPAQANILVRFGVSVGHYTPGACPLFVSPDTTGIGVMNAAIARGCIQSYQMDGEWLECVTVAVLPICSNADDDPSCCHTHYWAIYEDLGAYSPHALSGFKAGNDTLHSRLMGTVDVEHTELVVSYESWEKCIVTQVFCNPDA